MDFYIMYPGDSKNDLSKEENQLGSISFNKLWPKIGYKILNNLVNKSHPVLTNENTVIYSGKGTKYTVGEFYDYLINNKVKIHEIF